MKIAFTIATANYLGYAHTLADSLIRHNPDYTFVICLLDKNAAIDADAFAPHKVILIENIPTLALQSMAERYSVFELACALKPFAADFLMSHFSPDIILYCDSDACVLNGLQEAEKALAAHAVLITPHCIESFPDDGCTLSDINLLQGGIYNGGFFALANSQPARAFINWWSKKLEKYCSNNVAKGMFVDQLWLNFATLFFPQAHAFKNIGYNVSYWNMHERMSVKADGKYWVNHSIPLVFYHFSGFSFDSPKIISKYQNRYKMKDFPTLQLLFREYREELKRHGHEKYVRLICPYEKPKPLSRKKKFLKKIGKSLSFFNCIISKP